MRAQTVQTATSVACLASGALMGAAFFQADQATTIAMAAGGGLLMVATSAWGIFFIRKAFSLVTSQALGDCEHYEKTGLTEFDNLGRRIIELKRDAAERERHFELEISTAKDEARKATEEELRGTPAVAAELNAVRGYLDGVAAGGKTASDGSTVPCVERIKQIIEGYREEVASNVGQVVSCSREIHRTTEDLVNGSESQASSVEKTTSLVEQISSRMLNVCDNADEASEASTKVQSAAEKGLEQFTDLIDEMNQIRNQAAARERKLQSLGQHTKEIETIVQTIGTLSSRTDLLALNASIESVRAGEHGRGFAVVAEEVRALSEQSARAVSDISARLEMIQLETHQSISVSSNEHDQIHQVIERVSDTLDALQAICEAAGESKEGLSLISAATSEQLELTQVMVEALQVSSETARVNRSRAEGAHWKAKSFSQLSEQLEAALSSLGNSNG
jgi:uncharacterized protein Yka (UPF0111/DUF47 family)